MIFAPIFLGLNLVESALLGAALATISSAVVVPRMLTLIDEKFGTKKGIPQLILAGSSVDDIYALVLFSFFLSLAQSGDFSALTFLDIPLSILIGVLVDFLSRIGSYCSDFTCISSPDGWCSGRNWWRPISIGASSKRINFNDVGLIYFNYRTTRNLWNGFFL